MAPRHPDELGRPKTLWFRKHCPVNCKYNASHAYLCRACALLLNSKCVSQQVVPRAETICSDSIKPKGNSLGATSGNAPSHELCRGFHSRKKNGLRKLQYRGPLYLSQSQIALPDVLHPFVCMMGCRRLNYIEHLHENNTARRVADRHGLSY